MHITYVKIVKAVADQYSIPAKLIYSNKRAKDIVHARHVSVFILRHFGKRTYPDIANITQKDHTTALNSVQRIEALRESDPHEWRRVLALGESLYGKLEEQRPIYLRTKRKPSSLYGMTPENASLVQKHCGPYLISA